MTLLLIVYLVSVLSALKAFVSVWYLPILCIAVLMYIVVKLKLIQFTKNKQETSEVFLKYSDIKEKETYTLKVDVGVFKAGDLVWVNKYSSYCYLRVPNTSCDDSRIDAHLLCDMLEPKTIVTDTFTVTPLDLCFSKLKGVAITVLFLHLLLPTEDTLKYMGAGYLIQATYQSETVQQIGSLANKAVQNQLKRWASEDADIDALLNGATEIKQKAEAVVDNK